jgi:hypothetical protein
MLKVIVNEPTPSVFFDWWFVSASVLQRRIFGTVKIFAPISGRSSFVDA